MAAVDPSNITYLDTSFLFKLYVTEPDTEQAIRLFAGFAGGAVSAFSDLEMATSFHRSLEPQKASEAHSLYLANRASGVFFEVPFTDSILTLANSLAQKYAGPFKLRSLDTLHLAIAIKNGASAIATYDDRLAQAARAAGLQVIPA
jgi:predicted nucleic acid-binding protein